MSSFVTAVAPAVLATRAIASDQFQPRGLILPDRQVPADELIAYLDEWGIHVSRYAVADDG